MSTSTALRTTAAVLVAVLCALVLGACAGATAEDDDTIRVVATTNIVGDLVKAIGGDRVEVEALMGPGVDPHLYKASAGDVRILREADAIFYNGLELEGKLSDLLADLDDDRPVVAVAESIDPERLLDVGRGQFDPHVWFSVPLWQQAAETAADGLIGADPEGETVYRERLASYQAELDALDAEVRQELATVPEAQRVLVTSHDAFGYFAAEYGFEVVAIQGTSTVTEATTADIERVADTIADNRLPAVFIESSVPRQTIDAVLASARSRGVDAVVGGQLFGDAAGESGTPEGTYLGMVRHNVSTIAGALR